MEHLGLENTESDFIAQKKRNERSYRDSETIFSLLKELKAGNEEALDRLIYLYEPLVDKFVEEYAEKAQFVEDLRQLGITGLIEAIREYVEELDNINEDNLNLYSKIYYSIKNSFKRYTEKDPDINIEHYENLSDEVQEHDATISAQKELLILEKDLENAIEVLSRKLNYEIWNKRSYLGELDVDDISKLYQEILDTDSLDEENSIEAELDILLKDYQEKLQKLKDLKTDKEKTFIVKRREAAEVKEEIAKARRKLDILREKREKTCTDIINRWRDKLIIGNALSNSFRIKEYKSIISDLIPLIDNLNKERARLETIKEEVKDNKTRKFKGIPTRDFEIAKSKSYRNMAEEPLDVESEEVDEQLLSEDTAKLVIKKLLKEDLNVLLNDFTDKQKKIIELRYGLNGEDTHTYDDIGKIFGITRERIRQIESKVLLKLRHPSRSSFIKPYLDNLD